MQVAKLTFWVFIFSMLGCSDPMVEKVSQQTPITEQRLKMLAQHLSSGNVRNATLINEYANTVSKLKPELQALTNEFKKDAGVNGPMYLSLVDRLNTVKNTPAMFDSPQAQFEELLNIYQAADPVLFSDALSDPLNVLADMSDGILPRVNALSKQQSMRANNAQDFGTGEQLIGNPSYGQWQTNSSGMSFWAWYGMYSMIGDVFGSRRVGYSDWGRSRNYSYYNDYGRTRYSSPSQLKKQTQIDTRTKKSFASKGQKFQSAYGKNRTGSSRLSSQSNAAQTSANKFRRSSSKASSFANKSSYSKNASFRNSSSNTSRGFRSGK